ncbi:hypothetical protein Tsubulata_000994 [Turnera subulata]|uniref:protein-serine/threonine phosphatase n=1 Tax=Turnera subulata TaxID=218843 RepID=A0A9Q0FFA5_9ROSI|nr:hypothetical protein Tsubulata_000994 [Turnera subulata]
MGSCYSTMAKRGTNTVDQPSSAVNNLLERSGSSNRKRKKSTAAGGDDHSLLRHIPGRYCSNTSTKTACLYTQQGKKGINQDAMIFWENFCSRNDTVFCGVFDGHGPFGHVVAKKVRDSLPLLLSTQWEASCDDEEGNLHKSGTASASTNSEETSSAALDDESFDSLEAEESEKLPDMYLPLKKSILQAFKLMDKELKLHPTIDCFCSGTTAVTLIKKGQDLVIGNVGDSRAVLATRDKDNSLLAVQLTVDLKPDLPREAARIQQCKGRVFALQDEPEVARVWLPNNDSPGLAMARAFGDFCLKDFGLISVPDVYYRRLTKRDEFIILASDGVWDVLSNKEAVDVVASAPGPTTAARALVDSAVRAWKLKYPTSKNDDCAAVCLFLEHTSLDDENIDEKNKERTPNDLVTEVVKATEDISEVQDDSHVSVVEDSSVIRGSDEIVPVVESTEEKFPAKLQHEQSKRSLAEFISTADDEEWSALEGITRVNSLLSLPRFLSADKRSASWRKWL